MSTVRNYKTELNVNSRTELITHAAALIDLHLFYITLECVDDAKKKHTPFDAFL